MRRNARIHASAMAAVIVAGSGAAALSDTLPEDVFVGSSGDGLIFNDPAEGVLPPGIKAVTFTRTRIDDPDNPGEFLFVDPFEAIVTDFTGLPSRGDTTNCLDANAENVFCDSERGSGKRVKNWLTGRTPFDVRLRTTADSAYPSVDYFSFGKVSNFTGARMTGFSIELLDSDGNPMGALDPAQAVLYNLGATSIGLGSRLVDGLYGAGGNEGDIGFFSDARAPFAPAYTSDVLDFGALSNADYAAQFGTAFLDDGMVPSGLFWDDNDNPDDEAALVAWNNIAAGGWTWGNLALPADIAARLGELAAALGVNTADLGYVPGGLVPPEVVAAAQANGLFEVDKIEDLRNANTNYTITVGRVEAGEFIVRIAPRFAQIVEETQTEYQFRVAGSLDAANVPYLGADPIYLTTVSNVLAIADPDEQNQALERLGYSFLGAYSDLGFSSALEQVYSVRAGGGTGTAATDAEVAQGGTWFSLGNGVQALVSLSGSIGDVERSANGIGYDVRTASLGAGLEFPLSEGVSAGVLAGFSNAEAEIADGRGSLDQQALSFAVFGRGAFGANGAIEAIAGYQALSFDSTRIINAAGVSETATASPEGSVVFAAISGDHMFSRGNLSFGPTGAFEYYKVAVDGFGETGAGAYNIEVGEQKTSLAVARLGIRAEGAFETPAGAFRPYGHLGVARRSSDDALIETSFGGVLPGLTPVDGSDASWVDVGLGFAVEAGRSGGAMASFGADYRGAIGDDYTNHSARLFVEVSF